MSDSAIAARLVDALNAAAKAAHPRAALVSMELSLIDAAGSGETRARIARQTRTLMFAEAEIVSTNGARVAAASSVHKIAD